MDCGLFDATLLSCTYMLADGLPTSTMSICIPSDWYMVALSECWPTSTICAVPMWVVGSLLFDCWAISTICPVAMSCANLSDARVQFTRPWPPRHRQRADSTYSTNSTTKSTAIPTKCSVRTCVFVSHGADIAIYCIAIIIQSACNNCAGISIYPIILFSCIFFSTNPSTLANPMPLVLAIKTTGVTFASISIRYIVTVFLDWV